MNPEKNEVNSSIKVFFKNALRNYALTLTIFFMVTIGYLIVLYSLNIFLKIQYGWLLLFSIFALLFLINIILPFYKYPQQNKKYSKKHTLNLVIKRIFDLALVIPEIIAISPLLAIIALVVRADSSGPIFIKRKVIGLYGHPIKIIQFRTVRFISNEALISHLEISPPHTGQKDGDSLVESRDTKIGEFLRNMSFDNLPQIFNVLIGDLSIVGPRAIPFDQIKHFSSDEQRRFSFPPGISGLWQISKKTGSGFQEMLDLDLAYVDKWSLSNDIRIIFNTFSVVTMKKQ